MPTTPSSPRAAARPSTSRRSSSKRLSRQEISTQNLDKTNNNSNNDNIGNSNNNSDNNNTNAAGAAVSTTTTEWITLQQAQERAHGTLAWWRWPGPNSELVETRQSCLVGPENCLVLLYHKNGDMYLGGWKKYTANNGLSALLFTKTPPVQPAGFGVYLQGGEWYMCGDWDEAQSNGSVKQLWLPFAPTWMENKDTDSCLQSPSSKSSGARGSGIPFIYLGQCTQSRRNDANAMVILKDGTVHVGPWKDDAPVGNWWKDHKSKPNLKPEELYRILQFAMPGPFSPDLMRAMQAASSRNMEMQPSSSRLIGATGGVKPMSRANNIGGNRVIIPFIWIHNWPQISPQLESKPHLRFSSFPTTILITKRIIA